MTDSRATPPTGLDPRQEEVLKAILAAHLESGEPVGSGTVSGRLDDRASSATVRHVMSRLELDGWLVQPHRSAGRVPTEAAWRLYVDHWLERPALDGRDATAIVRSLRARGSFDRTLASAGRLLSQFTSQVGLVLAPEMNRWEIRRLEFVRLNDRIAEAILVSRAGAVEHRRVELDAGWNQDALDRCGKYLTDRYGGMTLPQMRVALRFDLDAERAVADEAHRRTLELARDTVRPALDGAADVIVQGASNLVEAPEFADPVEIRGVLRTFEEKRRLLELLSQLVDVDGPTARIGEESGIEGLERCSIVTSSYGSAGRLLGSVGIVGPIRMEYGRAFALVEHLGRSLSQWVDGAVEELPE
ncbi:MAG: heat-inducible transcriptional repressor HrcA [Planctomycetota bacterium]|nr:heat-inducible transcriptional repressor HrcA [Planctomycetota bacterium]